MTTLMIICMIIIAPSLVLCMTHKESYEEAVDRVAREVIKGKWGFRESMKENLARAGFDHEHVHKRVIEIMANKQCSRKYIRPILRLWVGVIGIILGFSILVIVIGSQENVIIGNSEKVATINTNRNIYYDSSTNEYFRLRTDDWNVFNIYYKEYIDNDIADRIIDIAEIVNQWED